MASNKELIEKILAINSEAKTEGLNNKQLTETLNLLKGDDDAPDAPPAPPKSKGLKVAEGRCITSLRGILEAGEPVTAKDFSGAEATFANLKKTGAIK